VRLKKSIEFVCQMDKHEGRAERIHGFTSKN
jgi:hypothetical protein